MSRQPISHDQPQPDERPVVQLGVVIPAGPRDDVVDTVSSVLHYTDSSRVVVVVNDTGGPLDLGDDPTVHVVAPPKRARGVDGALWVKIASGYVALTDRCRPRVVLRMDGDALMLGHGLADAAERRFAAEPTVGMLGAHRRGPDGALRDFGPAARHLASEVGWRGLRKPLLRARLRALQRQAGDGYEPGQHALGGAYIHSGSAVDEMLRHGMLHNAVFARSGLSEDHIMGLLTCAAGFEIGDFSGPGDPMAIKWRGIPWSPAELLERGALVTHSVRSWEDLDEPEIRRQFRERRCA